MIRNIGSTEKCTMKKSLNILITPLKSSGFDTEVEKTIANTGTRFASIVSPLVDAENRCENRSKRCSRCTRCTLIRLNKYLSQITDL